MEELGDFISHVNWENQQQETHAETADMFPHTPARGDRQVKTQAMPFTWPSDPVWIGAIPVPRGTQGQDDRVRNLDHGLQGGGDHDEEDDAEKESPLWCLHVQQARLESEQQQRDAFSDPSGQQDSTTQVTIIFSSMLDLATVWVTLSFIWCYYFAMEVRHAQVPKKSLPLCSDISPVHDVLILNSSVASQVKFA